MKSPFFQTLVIRRRPGNRQQGIICTPAGNFSCAIGKGGVTWRKREGDGATPVAAMRVLGGFHRPDRVRPGPLRLSLEPLAANDGWCDAPGDRNYNRPVRAGYGASHEVMWRTDRLYDVVLVLDWNIRPRARHRGSAIFMHVAREGLKPTEGCVAVAPSVMRRLLPLIGTGTVIRVEG